MHTINSISFIIPVYNAADTLEQCLKSINKQGSDSLKIEIIIADNGSTDASMDIAGKYTDKILTDADASISKLRNLGAEKAAFELLIFVDSDCILPDGWLKRILDHFGKTSVSMAGSKSFLVDDKASWVEKAWKFHLDRTADDKNADWLPTLALAVRKDVFQKAGGFDDSLETCEDVSFGYAVKKLNLGRIVSDPALSTYHLNNPKTCVEFFKNEAWRGKDSLKTSVTNLCHPKDIISISLPVYFLLAIAALHVSLFCLLFYGQWKPFLLTIMLLLLPALVMAFDTCFRARRFDMFAKTAALYLVYAAARTLAFTGLL